MRHKYSRLVPLAAAGAVLVQVTAGAPPLQAQTVQQEVGVLRVDWNDPELKRFKPTPQTMTAGSNDKLAGLRLPVLAFIETPLLVRNALGASAKPIKPRSIITDPAAPVWYHLVDNYGDISVVVDADLRINHAQDTGFQLHRRPLSLDGVKQGGKSKISIFDGAKEEGLEGVMVEYTVHKFPDIPYTVTIECRGAAKRHCRDVATITRDQDLLRVISVK
jgi:hypothetical protein